MRQSQRLVTLATTEEAHGGRENAGALVLALVEKLACRRGHDRVWMIAQVWRRHHGPQRGLDRPPGVGEKARDASERLVRLGVEDVQDGPDQERVTGLLPMVPPLQRAFGIDQDVSHVLDVADLGISLPDLEQRVVGSAQGIGRIKQEDAAEARATARSQLPVFALDVVNDCRARPREQGRDDKADALARSRRGKAEHMLGPCVAQIFAFKPAEHDAIAS